MNTLTVTIQKLEYGGYVMAVATDGQSPPAGAQFATTTLQELYQHQHYLAANHFKESPLPSPAAFRLQPRPERPMNVPQFDQPGDPDMPRVVTGDADQLSAELHRESGLVDKLRERWGNGAHVLAPIMLAAAWLTMNVTGRLV